MRYQRLSDLELKDKKVLLRLDLNVPMEKGVITDDTRIEAALPTINEILRHTSKLAIMSHLGRPKSSADKQYSLEPVGLRLAARLGREVLLMSDYQREPIDQFLPQLGKNQVILLENLRFHPEETDNDKDFAANLAKGFDIYIDDAFGAVHRAHASIAAVAERFPIHRRSMGLLIEKEIAALERLRKGAAAPYTVVVGGVKVADKIGILLNLINYCNDLVIGGAMAYTFLKYRGVEVGNSLVEADKMDLVDSIWRAAESRNVRIHLPLDHVAAAEFKKEAKPVDVHTPAIKAGLQGLDIGRATREHYRQVIGKSKTVLWNGPMGVFEWDAFSGGSLAIADALAACPGFTVVGGGDSVAAVNKAGVAGRIGHISTGGGASLEYLEGKTLPGLHVLRKDEDDGCKDHCRKLEDERHARAGSALRA